MDMQHQVMGYDRAATMFSPDGHLLQVEYAEKTVRLGSASIGMVCKDGVVIVADRRGRDKLIRAESAKKAYEVLSGIEGLLVLPVTESNWEEDKEKVARIRQERLVSA